MTNMYIGYAKDSMEEGAILIFAHTARAFELREEYKQKETNGNSTAIKE